MQERATVVTIAALVYFITGVAYALGTIPVTRHLIQTRMLPTFGGIRFYEGGFFDRQGINWVIAASILFILLGLGFILVSYWLWQSMKIGAVAAAVLFPIVIAVSMGSLAPFPWVVEPIKLILPIASWSWLT